MNDSITIIGGGLGGLTAAMFLADTGAKVTILEQGHTYIERSANKNEDILLGLGGAGTLSGGKLCFPPASGGIWKKTSNNLKYFNHFYNRLFSSVNTLITLPRANNIPISDELIHKTYRSEVILKDAMHGLVNDLLQKLTCNGVQIRCNCRVDYLKRNCDDYQVFFCNEANETEWLSSDYVLIATGRTSTPLLNRLFGSSKHHQPDLGLRLSMDTKQPAFSIIGEDVKLKRRIDDCLVRTFCVCCGGDSVQSSIRGNIHYDGHFCDDLTGITNLGIVARSPRYAGPGIADCYLGAMQKYIKANMTLKDFIKYHDLLSKGSVFNPLFAALTEFILDLYQTGLIVQNPDEIQVMIPAVDNLNPVIPTNSEFETPLPKLYVVGDAAGVSRGFIQAMWAGRCAASRISEELLCVKHPLAI